MRHSCWIRHRYQPHADGTTSVFRLRGQNNKAAVLQIGEKRMSREPFHSKSKMAATFFPCDFLGKSQHSDEFIVVDGSNRIWTTRTVRRLPAGDRWEKKLISDLKAHPWDLIDSYGQVRRQPGPTAALPLPPVMPPVHGGFEATQADRAEQRASDSAGPPGPEQ